MPAGQPLVLTGPKEVFPPRSLPSLLLWPHTDSLISKNAGDSERQRKGGLVPEGDEERDMILFLSRSLLLIEILLQAASMHFSTLAGSDAQNTMIRSFLLAQVGHRTKGRQREGPFSATPPYSCSTLNSVSTYHPICRLPSSQRGQGPHLC